MTTPARAAPALSSVRLGSIGLATLDAPPARRSWRTPCAISTQARRHAGCISTPNTVHYRLRRIERVTGRDVRRFSDVVDLVAALRLLAPH